MVRILHVGKPYTPPIIHGYTFEPANDGLWAAEVDEADFPKFMIDVVGSPFWVDPDPDAPVVVPDAPGTDPVTDPIVGETPGEVVLDPDPLLPDPELEPLLPEETFTPEDTVPDAPSVEPPQEPVADPNANPAPDSAAPAPAASEAFAEYKAAPNKEVLAGMALSNLGLTLDPLKLSRPAMEQAIVDELLARAQATEKALEIDNAATDAAVAAENPPANT